MEQQKSVSIKMKLCHYNALINSECLNTAKRLILNKKRELGKSEKGKKGTTKNYWLKAKWK